MRSKISIMFVGTLIASTGFTTSISCFSDFHVRDFVIKTYTGNNRAKAYSGSLGEGLEVYILSNSNTTPHLTETYSLLYSSYVNPKPKKIIEYPQSDLPNGRFPVKVDGKEFSCEATE